MTFKGMVILERPLLAESCPRVTIRYTRCSRLNQLGHNLG